LLEKSEAFRAFVFDDRSIGPFFMVVVIIAFGRRIKYSARTNNIRPRAISITVRFILTGSVKVI
jgi:hypothetical protein